VTSRRARSETSAGGVVVRCTSDGPRYLLIWDGHRNWGFPKGHLENGEAPEAAARREIAEETGVDDLTEHHPLGAIDWHFRHRGQLIHKTCHYFLYTSVRGDPRPQRSEGIRACEWCEYEDALRKLRFENARQILTQASALLADTCADQAGAS